MLSLVAFMFVDFKITVVNVLMQFWFSDVHVTGACYAIRSRGCLLLERRIDAFMLVDLTSLLPTC